ncbi:MAG: polysaccharide biosynthesis tyrosine autokinase, partial [Gemmataceae bacterium]|nr:polysaccharide biosynthesis tyrosine autokinase [Gemmataceae bacterium]
EEAVKKGVGFEAMAAATAADGRSFGKGAAERNLDEQLLPLQMKEQELLEDFGPDHPQVRSVRKRMELARDFHRQLTGKNQAATRLLADPVQAYVAALKHELRENEMNDKSLTQSLEKFKGEVRELSKYEVEEEHLRSEVQGLQQLLEATIKRLAEINLVRDAGGFDARILSRPGPGFKVAPNALQIILAGFILGALAGAGLAYLAEITDKSFRTPDEIRRRLGLPVFGHIPVIAAAPESARASGPGQAHIDPLLCALHAPKSRDAEAFRAIRTALYFSAPCRGEGRGEGRGAGGGGGQRVIQITSPSMGDGKSTVAANLAVSIAQSGKRILLIDADCRRPRQHKIFGLAAPVGLAGLIAGDSSVADSVQETAVPGLHLLPCGPVPHNPSELLTSPRFHQLLDDVRHHYDFVLVDTPPILAVTDPCVVASRVDGLLLTVRLSKQARPLAERAKEILNTLKVRVLGVVVNGVSGRDGAGMYRSDYYAYAEDYSEDPYVAENPDDYFDQPATAGDEPAPADGDTRSRNGNGTTDTPATGAPSPNGKHAVTSQQQP